MADILDLISPTNVGSDQISITLEEGVSPVQNKAFTIFFDYSQAQDLGGLVLPIELIVQPLNLDLDAYFKKVFRRSFPSSFSFSLPGAGDYLIVMRECFHNKFQGRLVITLSGDEFTKASR